MPELEPAVIYQYNTHRNVPWNIVEYQPLNEYLGKPVYSNRESRHVTRRGSFMDQHIKVVKDLPPPDNYPSKSAFDQKKNKEYSNKVKINPRLKKNSYIDDIDRMGKKTKIGVGSYNLNKTDQQLTQEQEAMKKYKRMAKSARPSFYENTQRETMGVPGAGNYHPHLSVDHTCPDRMTPDKWREKHKTEGKADLKKKRKIPGPSSYRPASAGTFDRTFLEAEKQRKRKSKSTDKGFGTDAKFVYCRPSRKKILETRPDPTRYDLSITWKGKNDELRRRGWSSFVASRSHSMSVYH